ncbi:hypothetical protein MPTK1_6g12080 [Marchantia polymorpha subsp. ruderalis]|uniref:Uncharacterized protein n=2 Tax=Marchantia polymorpha TaxID=3197 RepID=A0AAF6BR45_MARPO|nr:hypothetical protein MARPO_0135s0028 [Marchantia polymorpha]BBN14479.1 hypothetical protein Mp_6g12080 [Marchantia polymorpha subsp. ruderalis]|eukprot:PTQ29745.1 hypothetical protein MARPO_0135s0028 [Marchantia polymorpha]
MRESSERNEINEIQSAFGRGLGLAAVHATHPQPVPSVKDVHGHRIERGRPGQGQNPMQRKDASLSLTHSLTAHAVDVQRFMKRISILDLHCLALHPSLARAHRTTHSHHAGARMQLRPRNLPPASRPPPLPAPPRPATNLCKLPASTSLRDPGPALPSLEPTVKCAPGRPRASHVLPVVTSSSPAEREREMKREGRSAISS